MRVVKRKGAMMSLVEKRLNKWISETGICSRREADKLIEQGRVEVNGQVAEMGTKVTDLDQITLDGNPLKPKEKPIYIALNKPAGITCTTEQYVAGNIVDFVNHPVRIFPIGRLDKPSDGLIFLTNDGDIVNKILRAGNNHEKEYQVRVDKPITPEFLSQMAAGVAILDTVTLPCKITQTGRYTFTIILTQGLNRQIRRMCETLGYEVFKLRRVRIMNITLDGLASGQWRYLTSQEINTILALCEGSTKTATSVAPTQPQTLAKQTLVKQTLTKQTSVKPTLVKQKKQPQKASSFIPQKTKRTAFSTTKIQSKNRRQG